MTETTKRIIALKDKKGLNDHQLEVGAGLKPAFLQAWRNGKKNAKGEIVEVKPSTDSIIKLARYFNVTADYLLCLTDEPKPLENHEVAEIATAALPAEFGLSPDLFKDSNFIETAKLYNGVSLELRAVVFGVVLGAMQALKVDTKKILGY